MVINRYNQFIIEKQQLEYTLRLQKLNESLIDERVSFKEVVMGLAVLAGVISGSVTSASAKDKLKDKEVIDKIETVLNDKSQLDEVIDSLENKGMKDAAEVIQKNSTDVKKELKKVSKTTYSTTVENDFDALSEKLKKGWAISKITTQKAIQKIERDSTYEEQEKLSVDTLEINWSNDELFGSGLYKLSPQFDDSLSSVFKQLNQNKLSIVSITIESSTDKQRIGKAGIKLKEDGYAATNRGLSEARNNAVKKAIEKTLKSADSSLPIIEQVILHDQGKGEENAVDEQDPNARYVKLTIVCTEIPTGKPTIKTIKITDEVDYLIHSFRLVKARDIKIEIPPVKKERTKKYKSPKKVKIINCFSFKKKK